MTEMHTRTAILILALLPNLAVAQQATIGQSDPGQTQLQAATINGTASLREQVLHTRVNRDMLVSDYLQRTNRLGTLDHVLQSAHPVGGPRWIDDHTCQVRMELPASQIKTFLLEIARDDALHSPISTDALNAKLSSWNRMSFSGVGSSVGGDTIESARPHESVGKWSEVTDAARRSAVGQARANAAQSAMDQIKVLQLQGQTSMANTLARPLTADRLNKWLLHQPVTRIEFLDDLKVAVTLSISPTLLAEAVRDAVESDVQLKPVPAIDWGRLSVDIQQFPQFVTGSASAVALMAPTSLPMATLPTSAPEWVNQQLEADATASGGRFRLKTSRMAEANAVRKIREQLLSLDIASGTTIEDAVKIDPRLQQAVDRAMLHTHTHQVDYRADDTVKVRVSLDLQDAWDELRSNP